MIMLELTIIGSMWERSMLVRLAFFPDDLAATGLGISDFSSSDGDSKNGADATR